MWFEHNDGKFLSYKAAPPFDEKFATMHVAASANIQK
jgi:hypothetical protein